MASDQGKSAANFVRSLLGANAPRSEGVFEVLAESVADESAYIPHDVPNGFSHDEVSHVAGKVLRDEPLESRESFIAEAIIIPDLRPAIDIVSGDFAIDHPAWTDYVAATPAHANFVKAIPSVGRIELPGYPSIPYGGTGFIVGPGLLMTNRHVAQLFASGLGSRNLRIVDGIDPGIDFLQERDSPPGRVLTFRNVRIIHPYWDLALIEVEGIEGRGELELSTIEPVDAPARRIAVIGYPAFDPRNDAAVQDQVFHGIYNIKRFQPGLLNGRRAIESFGKVVDVACHDSSTLGGNSGSVVLEADSGTVIGLHFAGLYKDSNFAVPACDLACDGRIIDAGVNIRGGGRRSSGAWDLWWIRTEDSETTPPVNSGAGGGQNVGGTFGVGASASASITIPLKLSVTIDLPNMGLAVSASPAGEDVTEKAVEPFHDGEDVERHGYQADFIGKRVPMPVPRASVDLVKLANGVHVIPYHHFSIVMDRRRRLALFTAANVDARAQAKKPEPGYTYTRAGLSGLAENDREKWFNDPRIRGTEQLPDRFFNNDRSAFDKGHLVRREDVAWGESYLALRAANGDTYFTSNCSPQVAHFNRSDHKDNWGALEDLVLREAKTERFCLFSGPVLKPDDPDFVGQDDRGAVSIKIPRHFWKVVVANDGGKLRVFAFILKQDLSQTPMEFNVPESWKRHQLSLKALEDELDSIDFAKELHKGDTFDG